MGYDLLLQMDNIYTATYLLIMTLSSVLIILVFFFLLSLFAVADGNKKVKVKTEAKPIERTQRNVSGSPMSNEMSSVIAVNEWNKNTIRKYDSAGRIREQFIAKTNKRIGGNSME